MSSPCFVMINFVLSKNKEIYRIQKEKIQSYEKGNSGIDLITPETTTFQPLEMKLLSLDVKVEVFATTSYDEKYKSPIFNGKSSYYLYPRSSISKTPLMMANSVGIIDSSFCMTLKCPLRNMSNEPYTLEAGTAICQICFPTLNSFDKINFILEDSMIKTDRGEGFGSTDKK